MSGIILIALPFGLFLMMLHIKPDYVEKLWTHPLGIKMSTVALIMQVVGALVIKKIVNIKVKRRLAASGKRKRFNRVRTGSPLANSASGKRVKKPGGD